jgi:hypothetical protein
LLFGVSEMPRPTTVPAMPAARQAGFASAANV